MKHSSPLQETPPLLQEYLSNTDLKSWNNFRNVSRAAYDDLCNKLSSRQRGICAFCEIDLKTRVGTNAREVEHWRPKSLDKDRKDTDPHFTFEVDNLQLGCFGGCRKHPENDPGRTDDPYPGPNQSCGAFKGEKDPDIGVDQILPYRPSDLPESPAMFSVDPDGTIRPHSDCTAYGIEVSRLDATIIFLNLNCTRLKLARQAIYRSLDEALLQYLDGTADQTDDDLFDLAYEKLAEDTSPNPDEDLPRFITTIRSFFGQSLDGKLFPIAGWSVGR